MNPSRSLLHRPVTANMATAVTRAITGVTPTTRHNALRSSYNLITLQQSSRRQFSTTPRTQLEYFPPPKNAPSIKVTPPAWHHPMYTEEQLKGIAVAHRECKTWSDWVALGTVRLLRWGTDLATGYRHDRNRPFVMNERKWLIRFVFLESVAGVPGMVGGMLRHLKSLRRMQRDNGW